MLYQKLLFDWAAHQPALTGAALLAAGLLYGFCGFRMIRLLLVLPAAGIAALFAMLYASLHELSMPVAGGFGAIVGGAAAVLAPQCTVVVISGVTWAALGGYLSTQIDLNVFAATIVTSLAGAAGTVLTLVSRQAMTVLLTTVQGAALMVLGFVATSSALLPSLGDTFRSLAYQQSLIVPIMLAMLVAMAFSYQASARQGDIFTGMPSPPKGI